MKRVFLIMIAALLIALSVVALSANGNEISIYLNNESLESDTPPVIENGRTLVPFRALFEAFGANVSWDGETGTVTGELGGNTVKLTVDDDNAYINDTKVSLDAAPRIINDRTFVPLRFIAENFGYSVVWDGNMRCVFIDKITITEEKMTYNYESRIINVKNGDKNIFGVAYVPDRDGKLPLAICSHGLGGDYKTDLAYAKRLAESGIATYCFDFCGGGYLSQSDGKIADMSVMTEVSDLEAVLDAAKKWDFVDVEKILLLGDSQGGFVSAIVSARHADEIAGAVLCYPAFIIPDAARSMFKTIDEVPETYPFGWITLGRRYALDVFDYDAYSEINNFHKKILILHGNQDNIVPVSYSERAAAIYDDAEFFVIGGAGHGFSGDAFEEAMGHIFDYIAEIRFN